MILLICYLQLVIQDDIEPVQSKTIMRSQEESLHLPPEESLAENGWRILKSSAISVKLALSYSIFYFSVDILSALGN